MSIEQGVYQEPRVNVVRKLAFGMGVGITFVGAVEQSPLLMGAGGVSLVVAGIAEVVKRSSSHNLQNQPSQ